MKKKGVTREKEELKKLPFKIEGGKENSKTLPDCHERDERLFKNHAPSLALLFLSLNTRNTFKEHNKIMIGNYLSTMLVCVFAYLYPLFLCFKVRERTI